MTALEDRELTPALVAEWRLTGDPALRERILRLHLPLSRYLAARFVRRGEPRDDLEQVAAMGLLKAIDRFDPDRGVEFATYAVPTIVGELKRHFRDTTWSVKVPRGLQERSLKVGAASERLTSSLGRAPTAGELAQATGLSVDDVVEALEVRDSYRTASLDPGDSDDGGEAVPRALRIEDRYGEIDELVSLQPAVEALPEREREMLYLRFFLGLSQSEVGRRLGISQMHVSRQLRRSLDFLRVRAEDPSATF